MFQDHYDTQNDQKKMKWKNLQKQGLDSIQQGSKEAKDMVLQAVGMIMQDGGEIEMDQMDQMDIVEFILSIIDRWFIDSSAPSIHDCLVEKASPHTYTFSIIGNE